MSNTIRCRRYGHALAQKIGGGECLCSPGECRDRGEIESVAPSRKWTDLLGNPGMDQDCLARCATPGECIITGCLHSLPTLTQGDRG